jgi:hypothetical protein
VPSPFSLDRGQSLAQGASLDGGQAEPCPPRAAAIADKLAKLESFQADGEALASVVVRPDLASSETRRAFREAVVRAVVAGVIARQDAALLLQAARDQAGEDEPRPTAEPSRMVPMKPEDFHEVTPDA